MIHTKQVTSKKGDKYTYYYETIMLGKLPFTDEGFAYTVRGNSPAELKLNIDRIYQELYETCNYADYFDYDMCPWLELYLDNMAALGRSEDYIAECRKVYDKYLKEWIGKRKVSDLNCLCGKAELTRWIKPISLEHERLSLSCLLSGAMDVLLRNGLIRENHLKGLASLMKQPKSGVVTDYIPWEVTKQIIDGTEGYAEHYPIAVMACTLLKNSYLLGLKWQDIDFTGGTISVKRIVNRKREIKPLDRPFMIRPPEAAFSILDEYMRQQIAVGEYNPEGYLFPDKYGEPYIWWNKEGLAWTVRRHTGVEGFCFKRVAAGVIMALYDRGCMVPDIEYYFHIDGGLVSRCWNTWQLIRREGDSEGIA